MGNKARDVRVSGCLLLAVLLVSGCVESIRDNLQDPVLKPLVIPKGVDFDAGDGTVVVRWEYVGREVTRFRMFRRNFRTGVFDTGDWIDLPASGGESPSVRTDVQPITTFRDADSLWAGETYAYEVEVEDRGATADPTFLGEAQIPGVRIQEIVLNLGRASAEVALVRPSPVPTAYDLVRQVDGGPAEVVLQSEGQATVAFTDGGLEGNRAYRYFVRNRLPDGRELESLDASRSFYLLDTSWQAPTPPEGELRLATAQALGSDILALAAGPEGVVVRQFTYDGVGSGVRELTFGDARRLSPPSVSVAVPEIGRRQVLLSSVVPETRRVLLIAFALAGPVQIPWSYGVWEVSDPDARTAIAVGPEGNVFVVADDRLRVFTPQLSEVGEIGLGMQASIDGLAVDRESFWVLLSGDRRLLRSGPVLDGEAGLRQPRWQEVLLPPDARPIAVANDPGRAMFVLDAEGRQVLVFSPEGERITRWGLDGLDFQGGEGLDGGLAVLRGISVTVWDAPGQVRQFLYRERGEIQNEEIVDPGPSFGRGRRGGTRPVGAN